MRGTRTARIATSRSGKGVLAARTIAACTEIQDLNAMLAKRSSPGSEAVSVHGPGDRVKIASPGVVKITGKAARTNGKASAARLSTYPTPRSDSTSTEMIRAKSKMYIGQAPSGVSATQKMKASVSTNFTRGSRAWIGLRRGR